MAEKVGAPIDIFIFICGSRGIVEEGTCGLLVPGNAVSGSAALYAGARHCYDPHDGRGRAPVDEVQRGEER